MSNFTKKWERGQNQTIGEKVKEVVKPAGPLKPRLEYAVRQIQVQISKLDTTTNKLKERDDAIFNKVVTAIQKHDSQHASIYANELSEIRKMSKTITYAKVALEQITLRLGTIQELGDIVLTLSPAMSVIKNVKAGLVGVVPAAENEIGEIGGLLSNILVDAGQMGGYSLNFEAANEDAEMILSEASTVAEQRMKDKFPELPISKSFIAESEST